MRKFDFGKIKDCQINDQDFYLNKLYLTFDIDWAHDDILLDTIKLVENANVSATWFVTHETPLLKRLRDNPKFELGIHPNFNDLLALNTRNGSSVDEVVDRILKIVPEAKSVRSHSMTQNSKLMQLFVDKGLTHDCNHLIPEQAGVILNPWKLWNGLIKVPYFWEDDAVCLYDQNTRIEELLDRDGLKVFDFHPIHVFLNTENLSRYEDTRAIHNQPEILIKNRFSGYGTRSVLEHILLAV